MKKYFMLLLMLVVAVAVKAAPAEQLYLIGEPAGGWAPDKGIEMTKTADGVFELDIVFNSTQWFGFANMLSSAGNWDEINSHRYGAPSNNYRPEPNAPVKLSYPNSNSFQLPAGEYTFVVDTNSNNFTVKTDSDIELEPLKLYLRGDVNGWGALEDYLFTQDGDTFTLTIPSLSDEFKIATADWSVAYSTGEEVFPGTEYKLSSSEFANCKLGDPELTNVTITFVKTDDNAGYMTITGETGDTPVVNIPEALYMLGNVNGTEWNVTAGIAMTKTENSFAANVTVDDAGEGTGFFSFATVLGTAEGDWNTVNSGYRYGAATEGEVLTLTDNTVTAPLTAYVPEVNASACASYAVAAGEYNVTVTFDAEGAATVTLAPKEEVVVEPVSLYLRGDVNGWEALEDYLFTQNGDTFTLTIPSLSDEFKIATADWNVAYSTGEEVFPGTEYKLSSSEFANCKLGDPELTNVTITFVKTDDNSGYMTITGETGDTPEIHVPATLYVLGNVEGYEWNTSKGVSLTKSGNAFASSIFQINDAGEGYGYISFAETLAPEADDWTSVNSGYRYGAPAADTLLECGEDGTATTELSTYVPDVNASACQSYKVPAGGYSVAISFESGAPVLTLTKDSVGVEAVDTENVETIRYFNLQGMPVENPSNGVFIRVQGNIVSKVRK